MMCFNKVEHDVECRKKVPVLRREGVFLYCPWGHVIMMERDFNTISP